MRSRPGIAAIAFGVGAMLLLSPPARADWKKDYDRGLQAVEDGQWAEAENAFRAALTEDGAANARKRFQGTVFKVYVPHYYAGLAAYRQGNCARALEYWGNAGSTAVVAGQAALSTVQTRGVADCNQKLAAVSKPPVPVASTATPPAGTSPSTRPPATSTPTPPPVKPIETRPVVTAPPPAIPKPVVEPAKPPVVTVSTTPAPAALVGAVEGFLAGRYAAVVQIDPNTFADGRAKAQGFLLRAASRHTLAELADSDAKLIEQARQDVRAARAANSSLTPDETLFSPRFRAFWRSAR